MHCDFKYQSFIFCSYPAPLGQLGPSLREVSITLTEGVSIVASNTNSLGFWNTSRLMSSQVLWGWGPDMALLGDFTVCVKVATEM